MVYAWTPDSEIAKQAECGGAVTSLLKYALEHKMVDAVLVIKRGQDIYDAVPTLIRDPKEVCKNRRVSPLRDAEHCQDCSEVSRRGQGYEDRHDRQRLRPDGTAGACQAKEGEHGPAAPHRCQLRRNCFPVLARKMIAEKYGVDPDTVHKEEIDKGQFIIEYEGGHKGISIDELEEEGFGRRTNCRRCIYKVPRQADLACGNWGVIGEKAGKATFVEVCSDKGADLLSRAVKAGALNTEAPNPKGIEIRGKVEGAMLKLGEKWRKKDFAALSKDPWGIIQKETSRCIKCYSCIENCPVCFPVEEELKSKQYMVKPGEVPPNPMFHLRRFAHISDSCVNCGQCEELCPMEIPLARFSHAIRAEGDAAFESKLGKSAYTN